VCQGGGSGKGADAQELGERKKKKEKKAVFNGQKQKKGSSVYYHGKERSKPTKSPRPGGLQKTKSTGRGVAVKKV